MLDEIADAKAARVVARYLYDEALLFNSVDEERALTRPEVDKWLFRDDVFLAGHSAHTGRSSMPQAAFCILTNFLSRIVNEDRAAKRFRPRKHP
ncbi:hypothetical protein [Corynebacterium urogenitale]|uniref:hypothetical protein n=1 Tax=Corynebacterium urogenitale TaxID=2487892 RepID=UPI001F23FF1B|nr:hypothetical protein [Corynebacterium urogenitale]